MCLVVIVAGTDEGDPSDGVGVADEIGPGHNVGHGALPWTGVGLETAKPLQRVHAAPVDGQQRRRSFHLENDAT